MTAAFATLTFLGASVFQPYVGQTVTFAPGGATVEESVSDVDHVAAWLQTFPDDGAIQVAGYYCEADRLPATTDDDLLALAEHRATRLKALLVERGIDQERISEVVYGTIPDTSSCQATAFPSVDASVSISPIIGVGLALGLEDGRITVQDVIPDSPAEGDGTLRPGDQIVAVRPTDHDDWRSTAGLSMEQIVGMIRGAEDSVVGLRYLRASGADTEDLYLTRQPLKLNFLRNK